MKYSTHSLPIFVQFPIKSGILPDKLLPSILLQGVYGIKRLQIKKMTDVEVVIYLLTNLSNSLNCQTFLVYFL